MASTDIGTGTTITFQSGFFAEITSVDFGAISRESIDSSHMGIAAPGAGTFGNRTFIFGDLSDPGELTVEMHFQLETPPINQAAETVTVTFPSGGTWVGQGAMTGFTASIPLEDKMVATATIKFSGAITVTT